MNLWTIEIRRTLHTRCSAETQEEAERLALEDAMEQGIIAQDEVDDGQWEVEATEGIALQWVDE